MSLTRFGHVRQHDTPLGEAEGEPWRYVCPECGSVSVLRRSSRAGERGETASGRYYCEGHNGPLGAVYDKREGVEVRP